MIKEELTKLLMEAYERGQSDLIKSCQETVSIAIDTAILAEREACAKLADEWAVNWPHPAKTIALDIRARGNVATNDTSQERVDKTSEIVHEPEYLAFMDTPQRKPLSDEEILTYKHMIDWTAEWSYINFARAIEAAHGIKGEA